MSVPNSVDELLGLIRKSGMVDDQKLNAYLQARTVSADPTEVAAEMVRDALITGFQKEQFLLGKWRGFTVGKYKLLERVGIGGMGQVFLGEHMFMKRRVALKVLPPAKAEHPAALGRFYREARAAGSLEHPNIVRTHDIDQDGNLHFIVMEYVDGANLLDTVKKFGPMPVGRAAHVIRQVAIGLDYAFRSGIIHRDIKPGNILVDRRGTVKILDMGLARFYNDTSDMLTVKYDDKTVLGTADYVAPEQVANSHAVDVRADVYSMGASLYFLLAGHPPFPQGTVSQKLLWHRTKDPTPIRELRPDVPEPVAQILQTLMRKDPNLRYQTPVDVAVALEPWVPAFVPPPTTEEMPKLSPAALEGAPVADGSSEMAAVSPASGVVPQTAAERSRASAFAPASGVFGPAAAPPSGVFAQPAPNRPIASGPLSSPGGPFGPAPMSGGASGTLAPPSSRVPGSSLRPQSSPFGPQIETPANGGYDTTSAEYPPPIALQPATQTFGPPTAPVPLPAAKPPLLTYAIIVVVSVVLAGGGMFAIMKFTQ
ncbi:MAG: serine/threonine protein kinase [Fimbriiglobus sp.]